MKKKTLARRLFMSIAIPFSLVMVLIYLFVFMVIRENQNESYKLRFDSTGKLNTSSLGGKVDAVASTVTQVAEHYGVLLDRDIRDRTVFDEDIVKLLQSPSVLNSWFVFEPNAFDGRDAEYVLDYPGAPSGRFMRSYVHVNGEVTVAPDMDENDVDDPALCPWYAVPFSTKSIYIDYSSSEGNFYDYQVEGVEPSFALSVAVPVYDGGRVIGCVGADVMLEDSIFDTEQLPNAYLAAFYEDGTFFYAPRDHYDGGGVQFVDHAEAIQKAFAEQTAYFNANYLCPMTGKQSYVCFYPAKIENCRTIFLYMSFPIEEANHQFDSIVLFMTLFLSAILLTLTVLLYFTSRIISRPIKTLTVAANRISLGDINARIPVFEKPQDELSVMSRSIYQMAEQLRINLHLQKSKEWVAELSENIQRHLYGTDDVRAAISGLSKPLAPTSTSSATPWY